MIPGLTSRTLLSLGVYFSAYSGTSGRGPTRLISPRTTLSNCGISSSFVILRIFPTLVMRASPNAVSLDPCLSVPSIMVRNLKIWKVLPYCPTRRWRKKMGPRESSRTATAQRRRTGLVTANPTNAPTVSMILLPARGYNPPSLRGGCGQTEITVSPGPKREISPGATDCSGTGCFR